jgi:hypothetical protein
MEHLKFLLIGFLMVLLAASGCASNPKGASFELARDTLSPDKARITIYRDSDAYAASFSWLVAQNVSQQSPKPLAVISRNTYYRFDTAPTRIELLADLQKSPIYAPVSPLAAVAGVISAAEAKTTNDKIDYVALHDFEAKPGQEYYFKLEFKDAMLDPSPYLVQVTVKQAMNDLKKSKMALLPKT